MIRRINKKDKNNIPISEQMINLSNKKPVRRLKPGLWSKDELVPGYIYDITEQDKETKQWKVIKTIQIVEIHKDYTIAMYFENKTALFMKIDYEQYFLCGKYKYIIRFVGSINYKIFQGGLYVR